MAANLNINERLLADAVKAGKHRSKREAVETALRDYVRHQKQIELFRTIGPVEYWPGMDPLSQRRRARGQVVASPLRKKPGVAKRKKAS